MIMIIDLDLVEQMRMLHQQFHLSPQNLREFLPELAIFQCKHLVRSCTACTPLVPLGPLFKWV